MSSSPRFVTTHWTLVLQAADRHAPEREQALAELLQSYWYPLYSFIRRQGYAVEEAEDLLQSFLARLLEKDSLRGVAAGQGRFRNFLLVCLRRFLANEHERSAALKRGGGVRPLSLDFQHADARYRHEPAHDLTPQRLFERDWALELIQGAMTRLAEAWRGQGKDAQFAVLRQYLVGPEETLSYAEAAGQLASTEGAVKTAVHRLRSQFRQFLCEEAAATLDRDDLLEDEIRRMFSALET